jgi:hypothetical protein
MHRSKKNSTDNIKWRVGAIVIKVHILGLTPDIIPDHGKKMKLSFKPFMEASVRRHSVSCKAVVERGWTHELKKRARVRARVCVCVCARADMSGTAAARVGEKSVT